MYKEIILIAGVARSGTSWLGQVIDSSPTVAYRFQPLFSYAFKAAVNEDSSQEEFSRFFEGIYNSQDRFLLQSDNRESGLYPTFNKIEYPEYLAFKENRYQYCFGKMLSYFENLKLVGIVRHPCGVINSWLKNPKEFPVQANPREEWRFGACKNQGRPEEFFGFYKWKEVAHMYLDLQEKYPEQVYVVKYEELVDNPTEIIQDIFDFVNLELAEQTLSFLTSSHAAHKESPYSVFRSKSVKEHWRSELDPYIANEIIKDITGTRLARFL